MSKSLQDQLLKAGLVDEKKLKQAKRAQKKQAKQLPKGQSAVNETREVARQALEERARADRERNLALQADAELRAVAAQIKQMIQAHRIERGRGDVPYQFVDGTKIKKLYASSQQQDQLARGQIAIARLGEGYELIPARIAAKIQERDESAILVLHDKSQQQDQDEEDDPYADYPIPDDLMW